MMMIQGYDRLFYVFMMLQ